MQDGFITAAAAAPRLRVAGCAANAKQIIEAAREAAGRGARVLVTPELGLSGSSCGELFLQASLLEAIQAGLQAVCEGTKDLPLLLLVGAATRHRGALYNCAAVINQGRVLGLVPKSTPEGSSSMRYFSPAFAGIERCGEGFLRGVPIGGQLLFRCDVMPTLTVAAEIGQDVWMPMPPSVLHAAVGATVIAHCAADSETVGRARQRRELVSGHSGRLLSVYVSANAGDGESTTDAVFAGQGLVAENGSLLAEAKPFSGEMALAQVDIGRVQQERLRFTAYPEAPGDGYAVIPFHLPLETSPLARAVSPMPFVPEDRAELAERCETILNIQAAGLAKRLEHTHAKTAVIGVSGGQDSSLALLVAARAFEQLGRPAGDILAVTMPGFGTTARTKGNAERLCEALGIALETINLTATVRAHFKDIGHSEHEHSVVYENAQARMRTLTLMNLANQRGGLVVGTGDLSELALGWATYGGDHISMYGVNAGVPKTLLRHLLAWQAKQQPALTEVLQDILDTPVSPELLPAENGKISQKTEQLVGPYALHDFFLYYVMRWGFTPRKIARLARAAFAGQYDDATILQWMAVFYRRFFAQQFKRSCLPDGPAVGSVSLSPRGGWQMPSDAAADAWLTELDELVNNTGQR